MKIDKKQRTECQTVIERKMKLNKTRKDLKSDRDHTKKSVRKNNFEVKQCLIAVKLLLIIKLVIRIYI